MAGIVITSKANITYELTSGVVLGDKFLSKDDFRDVFFQALKDSDSYEIFNYNLSLVRKIITITKNKKGKIQTITEFTNELDQIQSLFSQMMLKGLGGNISLLTTFDFGKNKSQETYFLMKESDLPSLLNENGEKTYLNTKENLNNLIAQGKKLKKLDESLDSHLRGFSNQLTKKNTQSKDERQQLYIWAYYNMKERFKKNRNIQHPISLSKYFWGNTSNAHGHATEAFGTHLALMHPNTLMNGHIEELKKSSVIQEHGGAGSHELFSLLYSTKGNIMSQLSGDIVVVDGNGNVTFNIQSKASRKSAYNFTITYQQFLKNIMLFKDIYEKNLGAKSAGEIPQEDIDALFKAFSTQAWVPIQKVLGNKIDETVDELIRIK